MNKIVILDRDGVINIDLMTYVTKPAEFEPISGSLEAISLLNKNGYKVAIATNQACVERNIISENELKKVHDYMESLLSKVGGKIITSSILGRQKTLVSKSIASVLPRVITHFSTLRFK